MSDPKEKAQALVERFRKHTKISSDGNIIMLSEHAKACALICVDEILKVNKDAWSRIPDIGEFKDYIPYIYWQRVKTEIEKT